ncbi:MULTISPECIES: type II secretion system F family protein [unclassified Streptomyces]|uniref:type II secretion system F family protein n=1 Tax=unclassified Streptomyces TaxID=2593676 RepID=UPI002E2A1E79|nr:type II secretion system F family protein [Streptomyces sp. NBC_00223]
MSGATVHSLGMTVAVLAAAFAGLLLVLERRQHTVGVRRLRKALGERRVPKPPGVRLARIRGPFREWGPTVAAGLGACALVGGPLGGLAGVAAALGARAWLGRRQRAADSPEARVVRPDPAELPLCADLMAACLAAGATPGEAAGAVGRCLGGPLGAALIRAQAELRLGGEAAECWDRFGRLPEARDMGRCLARASTTGSAPVAEMSRLAADYRAAHARSALAGARKAAVLATAPLGVCFLPAFLLVGVAPVVIGLAGPVLRGGMR